MFLLIKVKLFKGHFNIFYVTPNGLLCKSDQNKALGLNIIKNEEFHGQLVFDIKNKLKCKATAYFLKPFIAECCKSEIYRKNVLSYLHKLCGNSCNNDTLLKMKFVPPDLEIIDYAWNYKILRLIWTKVELDNAFSWLSTLGGAFSALGDYFENCAEEAGRISVTQYKLSIILGDESMVARCLLYAALSYSQKGDLKLARRVVRNVANTAIETKDKRLLRMCHGVWAKLQYLKDLKKKAITKPITSVCHYKGKVILV